MPDPAATGARVLAALDRGRQRAIERQRERGAVTVRAVRRALDLDALEGRPERGRPGRIARRLRRDGLRVSERQVRRILDALSGVSDSSRQSAATVTTPEDRAA